VTEQLLPDWRHRVEHVDTDASGVTHFSRYASLVETVLLETLEADGAGLTALSGLGVELVVTELRIKYLAPAWFRDVVVGAAGIEHVGGAVLRGRAALFRVEADGGHIRLVAASVSLASVSASTGQPVPVPKSVRSVWKGLMAHA